MYSSTPYFCMKFWCLGFLISERSHFSNSDINEEMSLHQDCWNKWDGIVQEREREREFKVVRSCGLCPSSEKSGRVM